MGTQHCVYTIVAVSYRSDSVDRVDTLPESMTNTTSSMVIEDSAMLVAITTYRKSQSQHQCKIQTKEQMLHEGVLNGSG